MLRGDDVGITDNTTDLNLGVKVGLYRAIPVGAGFAVQPEVMYTQKGGVLDAEALGNGANNDVFFNIDYVEVPVAMTYTVPTQSRYVPMLYAGPYASLAARRQVEFEVDNESSLTIDADEAFEQFDYGAIFGADLGVKLNKRMATIGVRYDLGLADIAKDGQSVDGVSLQNEARTHEWGVLVGVRF